MKEMSGKEFGNALLAALEENEGTKPLRVAIRKALGLAEPEHRIPAPFVQKGPPPEFPQWRIRYSSSGNEIARRRCDSAEDLARLFNSEREMLWPQSFAVPIEEKR